MNRVRIQSEPEPITDGRRPVLVMVRPIKSDRARQMGQSRRQLRLPTKRTT